MKTKQQHYLMISAGILSRW